MLRSIFVLLSCGAGYFVYAHPHCHYDQREVDFGRDLTFCSMDYAPEGVCCTEEEETALEETFNAVGDLTTECADNYKQVLCHCMCVFSSHSFWTLSSLDVPAGVTQEEHYIMIIVM